MLSLPPKIERKKIEIPPIPKVSRGGVSIPKVPSQEELLKNNFRSEIIKAIKNLKLEYQKEIDSVRFEVNKAIKVLNANKPKFGIDYFTDRELAKVIKLIKDSIKIRDGVDGRDAEIDEEALVKRIIDSIKKLKGNDRIDISSIRNGIVKSNFLSGSGEIDQRWSGNGGGGSNYTNVAGEEPTGTINGVNTTFVLAHTPVSGTLSLFVDGSRLINFTLTGTTIESGLAPTTQIVADYQYV